MKMPYWTPAGIVMDEPPPAYAAAIATEESKDWDKLLGKHGYKPNGRIGQEYQLVDVDIWQHEDGHLMVEHHVAAGDWIITFFIRPDDVYAWALDGYLTLVQTWAQAEQAAAFSRLAKSVTAFIRHGHGEDTIDEYGDYSEDDRRRAYERRQARISGKTE